MVNDLANLGERVVLVIADFQVAAAAAPSLSTLIGRLPAGCRVVVVSRAEPGLGPHRLRAYGQLLEVRDPELRLTRAEVAATIRQFEVELTKLCPETVLRLSRFLRALWRTTCVQIPPQGTRRQREGGRHS